MKIKIKIKEKGKNIIKIIEKGKKIKMTQILMI